MNEEIPKNLEEAHHIIKTHLNYRATADYILETLYCNWLNIYWDWQEYVSKCLNVECIQHIKIKE